MENQTPGYRLFLIGSEASRAMSPGLWNPVFEQLGSSWTYEAWDVPAGQDMAGVRAALLGAGGAARAALIALRGLTGKVTVTDRNPQASQQLLDLAASLGMDASRRLGPLARPGSRHDSHPWTGAGDRNPSGPDTHGPPSEKLTFRGLRQAPPQEAMHPWRGPTSWFIRI